MPKKSNVSRVPIADEYYDVKESSGGLAIHSSSLTVLAK